MASPPSSLADLAKERSNFTDIATPGMLSEMKRDHGRFGLQRKGEDFNSSVNAAKSPPTATPKTSTVKKCSGFGLRESLLHSGHCSFPHILRLGSHRSPTG